MPYAHDSMTLPPSHPIHYAVSPLSAYLVSINPRLTHQHSAIIISWVVLFFLSRPLQRGPLEAAKATRLRLVPPPQPPPLHEPSHVFEFQPDSNCGISTARARFHSPLAHASARAGAADQAGSEVRPSTFCVCFLVSSFGRFCREWQKTRE